MDLPLATRNCDDPQPYTLSPGLRPSLGTSSAIPVTPTVSAEQPRGLGYGAHSKMQAVPAVFLHELCRPHDL